MRWRISERSSNSELCEAAGHARQCYPYPERFPRAVAIDDGRSVLDYLGLLQEVRRVGDRLASVGTGGGDRVGIRVCSGTAELYLSILAVLSVGAAYVPVDVDDPDDRAELVWSAAGVCVIIGDGGELIWREVRPAGAGARRPVPEDGAWIIFTSGTTGTPKGVAVTHRNAAAFVDAEARLFLRGDPLGPGDRVLAGLSVAFDASCEEMWLAWRHGACLVPAARSVVKTGPELVTWLAQRRVSVVSTVPTMASLWPADSLRGIRLLVLGGEACPSALADRLVRSSAHAAARHRPGGRDHPRAPAGRRGTSRLLPPPGLRRRPGQAGHLRAPAQAPAAAHGARLPGAAAGQPASSRPAWSASAGRR